MAWQAQQCGLHPVGSPSCPVLQAAPLIHGCMLRTIQLCPPVPARTTQVWSLGNPTPNMTLEGHEKGVNCVDYYSGQYCAVCLWQPVGVCLHCTLLAPVSYSAVVCSGGCLCAEEATHLTWLACAVCCTVPVITPPCTLWA